MSRRCDFPIEDLIDYADGLLAGERKAAVEAHVRTCFACQRRTLSADDMGRLFREQVVARGAGFQTVIQPPTHVAAPHQQRNGPWRSVLAAAVILMVLIVALEPVTSLADFRLARIVAFITPDDDGSPSNLPGHQEPPGTSVASLEPSSTSLESLPFQAVMPPRLPLDLTLVEHLASTEGWLDILYRNGSGFTIQLIESAAGRSGATGDVDAAEWVLVDGTEILLQRDSSLTASVYRALWERDGVLFELAVTKSPSAGLSVSQVTDIVEAVMLEQETSR